MHKSLKKAVKLSLIAFFLFIFFIAFSVVLIFLNHKGTYKKDKIYDYGVVFGAAIRSKGRLSKTLESRMLKAIELYKNGTIKTIVLSGAKYGEYQPGEPKAMFNFAAKKGVNPKDMLLDEKGDNTLLTLINYKKSQANQKNVSVLFISSFFHLARINISSSLLKIKDYDTASSVANHPKVVYFVFRESVAIWYYILKSIYYQWFVL